MAFVKPITLRVSYWKVRSTIVDGKDELEGTETVVLGEISEAAYQKEQAAAQEAKQIQIDTALAELSILIASALPYSE